MMAKRTHDLLSGILLDDSTVVSLAELCNCCALPAEQVLVMVEHGIIEPLPERTAHGRWQFTGQCVLRVQTAVRLQRDLGINLAGAALALDLLDEIRQLRQQTQARSRN